MMELAVSVVRVAIIFMSIAAIRVTLAPSIDPQRWSWPRIAASLGWSITGSFSALIVYVLGGQPIAATITAALLPALILGVFGTLSQMARERRLRDVAFSAIRHYHE